MGAIDSKLCVILGGGGHASVLIDMLKASQIAVPYAILDDDRSRWGSELLGVPILGDDDLVSELITKAEASEKTWDAYLVLTCRSQPHGYDELNELSNILYDTKYTRKIVRAGLGESLEKVIEVAKPFISLEKARYTAKQINPLELLEEKLVQTGWDHDEIKKLITVFNERGNLENV